MADDIVTRLRDIGFCGVAAQQEAATEIERLRAAGNALHNAVMTLTITSFAEATTVMGALAEWQSVAECRNGRAGRAEMGALEARRG